MIMGQKASKIISILFIAVFLAALMTLFSASTSPFYPEYYGVDSAFFRFFGTEILKGKTPYTDIWDNKGPVLFFIQALGAAGGTRNSGTNILFLLQLAAAFCSLFFMYRSDRILNGSKSARLPFILYSLCTCLVLSQILESGNLTEEWSLPIIWLSLFLMTKYAVRADKEAEHPPLYAFLYGFCFGLLALIRLNNAITICAGVCCIGTYLIQKRKWKNLLLNLLCGLLGIITAAAPVVIWYAKRSALSDMLYAVFLYNFKYLQHRSQESFSGMLFILRYFPIGSALLIIVIHWIRSREKRFFDILILVVFAVNSILLIRSNSFLHYFMIFVPVLFWIFAAYGNPMNIPELLITLCLSAVFLYSGIRQIPNLLLTHRQDRPQYTVIENIPPEERSSAIAVHVPPSIYLNTGLEPVSRFCAYQFIHFSVDPDMKTEFLEKISLTAPLWIITPCNPNANMPEVLDMIREKYHDEFNENDICFYRLNE